MAKIRGPKPSDEPGKKRKATEELSANPHTEKCRKRLDGMTDTERKLERYKNNDRQAKTVELKKLRETLSYKNAPEDERKRMEEQIKTDVMEKRYKKGQSARWLEEQLGLGDNAANATWDDGNQNWEDIPFDDDIESQKWAQKDDLESLEVLPSQAEADHASARQKNIAINLATTMNMVLYKHTRIYCLGILNCLLKKEKNLAKMSWEELVKKGMDNISPHEFFGREERLVWRIVASTISNSWITLPGPSEWWRGYSEADFQKYWDVPSGGEFKKIVNLAYTLFVNREAPKNAAEIVEEIQLIGKLQYWLLDMCK